MEITTKARYIRISPRKAQLAADLVRGRQAGEALAQLKAANKKSARLVSKLLKSALANAKHNYDIAADNLFIKEIWVGKGATFHRWAPKAHGRATPIRKETSHVTVVLKEIHDSGPRTARRVETAAPLRLADLIKGGAGKVSQDKNKEKEPLETEIKGENLEKAAKQEGSSKSGFVKKVFNRKSG